MFYFIFVDVIQWNSDQKNDGIHVTLWDKNLKTCVVVFIEIRVFLVEWKAFGLHSTKKNPVSMKPTHRFYIETFFFFCAQFHVKLYETGGIFSVIFFPKRNWLWFHNFKGLKLWNRPELVGKKMKLTTAAKPRAVSFIFFPDQLWTVS